METKKRIDDYWLVKIDNAYRDTIVRTGMNPSAIIMHPKSCKKAVKELMDMVVMPKEITNPTFRGAKIYRTKDVLEDQIIVL